jgi:hypothetical protein
MKKIDKQKIKELMKFFISKQIQKGEVPKLTPIIYHNTGIKKNSLNETIYLFPIFREILGEDYIKKFISKFENKPIYVTDYDNELSVGGYDFTFIFEIHEMRDDFPAVFVDIEPGGEVTLMTDDETYTFEEMEEEEHEAWGEVQQEINDLIIDILRHELTEYTGLKDFSVESIIYY